MTPVLDLLTDALASYRATRLIVEDDLLARPRDALTTWLDKRGHDMLVTMLGCPFCVGVYASATVLLLRRRGGRAGRALVSLLAVAGAQALLSAADERLTA